MDSRTRDIRNFIGNFFNDTELTTFCFDYFPIVEQEFTNGMSRSHKIQLLLDHCRRQERIASLLAALERERPQQARTKLTIHLQNRISSQPPKSIARQYNPRQIFISYASQDVVFAQRLANDLQKAEWPVWIAPNSIHSGEKWVDAINRGLENSGIFVLVLTSNAVSSKWVKAEANAAISLENQGKIRFYPLLLESCQAPPLWQGYQWILFNENYKKGWQELLQQLNFNQRDRKIQKAKQPQKSNLPTPRTTIDSVQSSLLTQPKRKSSVQLYAEQLYHRAKQANRNKDWSEVIYLGERIQATAGDYRDIQRLVNIAKQELQRPRSPHTSSANRQPLITQLTSLTLSRYLFWIGAISALFVVAWIMASIVDTSISRQLTLTPAGSQIDVSATQTIIAVLETAIYTTRLAETAVYIGDDDDDGLTNMAERTIGTDPNNSDSDDDGLSDGDEALVYGSDPNNIDTDGDLFSDGDEVNIYRTDPTNSDTDGDGVPDGTELTVGTDPLVSNSTPTPNP